MTSNEEDIIEEEIIEEEVLLPEDGPHPEQERMDAVVEESEPWWRFGEKWLPFGTKSYQKPVLYAIGVSIFVHFYGTVYFFRAVTYDRDDSFLAFTVTAGCLYLEDTLFPAFFLCVPAVSLLVEFALACSLFFDLGLTAIYTFFLLNWFFGVFGKFDSEENLGTFIKYLLAAVISLLDHGLLIWLCMLYRKELKDAKKIIVSTISYSPIVFRSITPPVPIVSVVAPSLVTNTSNTYNIGTININNGTLQALEAVRDIDEERLEVIACGSSTVDETGE